MCLLDIEPVVLKVAPTDSVSTGVKLATRTVAVARVLADAVTPMPLALAPLLCDAAPALPLALTLTVAVDAKLLQAVLVVAPLDVPVGTLGSGELLG